MRSKLYWEREYKISQKSVLRWESWHLQTEGQTSRSQVSNFASLQTLLNWVKFLSRLVIHFAMTFEWRCSRIFTENLCKMEVNVRPRVSATFPTPLRIGIDSWILGHASCSSGIVSCETTQLSRIPYRALYLAEQLLTAPSVRTCYC